VRNIIATVALKLHRSYTQANPIEPGRYRGDRPGPRRLPLQQSTKFEFVINRKTAKALGLDFR
jgi:hypothetical protein